MPTRPSTLKRQPRTPRHEPEPPSYGQGRGGRPWRRLRVQALERDNYLCQCPDCKKRLVPLPAHEVDHISNRRDEDGKLNDDPGNLRSVNRDCHKRITQAQTRKGRT